MRKTVEEMELRFEKQKATLAQREETIKKLLERLQKKTAEMNALQEEMNHSLEGELSYKLEAAQTEITSLHNQKAQWEYKLHKLEKVPIVAQCPIIKIMLCVARKRNSRKFSPETTRTRRSPTTRLGVQQSHCESSNSRRTERHSIEPANAACLRTKRSI